MDIETVTVIGANGTMGTNASGIFASFGDAKVYMVCRNIEDAKKAKLRAAKSIKAEAIEINLIPKTYDDLEECVSKSDLIFESVSEDIEIKKVIYNKIANHIQPHTIIGTGTSGLSVNVLSECLNLGSRKNFMGIHMFNPPYSMTLCEVIPSKYTSENTLNDVKCYLEGTLFRDVVEVKDEPAFMGNRIGFQFINEAMQYAERYKSQGGIDYIDSIIGLFTGRNMSPLTTADFVGLDVHKAIVDNLYKNTNDYAHSTFEIPEFTLKLIEENKLGRKTNGGFYKTSLNEEGNEIIKVYDILTGDYRVKKTYNFPFATKMIKELRKGNYENTFNILKEEDSLEANICLELLTKYVIYGILTTKAIGKDIYSADDVMATGFSWVPPLALIEALGGIEDFKNIATNKLSKDFLMTIDIDEVLLNIPESKYDYRKFFKAK